MKFPGAILLLLAASLVACRDAPPAAGNANNNTAVLGAYGNGPKSAAPLTDAFGRVIPAPATSAGGTPQVVRSGDHAALALWLQGGHVVASAYAPGTGWGAPQPLEAIYGEASDPQLASNGKGVAMAVWRHTVGSIQSLRYSRFESTGWSVPDVMPGALPRPHADNAAPQLHMDAEGRAFAEWPSGFNAQERQSASYVPGQGWSPAQSEPLASAGPAAPVTTSGVQ